jgi:hypothetical protein
MNNNESNKVRAATCEVTAGATWVATNNVLDITTLTAIIDAMINLTDRATWSATHAASWAAIYEFENNLKF